MTEKYQQHNIKTHDLGKHTVEVDLDSSEDTLAVFGASGTATRISLTVDEVVELLALLYDYRDIFSNLRAQSND